MVWTVHDCLEVIPARKPITVLVTCIRIFPREWTSWPDRQHSCPLSPAMLVLLPRIPLVPCIYLHDKWKEHWKRTLSNNLRGITDDRLGKLRLSRLASGCCLHKGLGTINPNMWYWDYPQILPVRPLSETVCRILTPKILVSKCVFCKIR